MLYSANLHDCAVVAIWYISNISPNSKSLNWMGLLFLNLAHYVDYVLWLYGS